MTEVRDAVGEFDAWLQERGLSGSVVVEELRAPHSQGPLPVGRQGVYCFRYDGAWLKVGKAGPNSGARWFSHHYNIDSANSTLAFSLLRYRWADREDPRLPGLRAALGGVASSQVGTWIKRNTDRVNLLMGSELGRDGLSALELIAQRFMNPVFEGPWKFGGPAA